MSEKVLVCDDQKIVREVLSRYLAKKGYEVVTAREGSECIALVKEQHFDVIFLDIKMPKLDGISVLRELRRLNLKSQIILMSGFQNPEVDRGGGNHEKVQFLAKPFTLESVIAILDAQGRGSNRILVVDDQDMLREMLCDFLRDKGFEIFEARNGKECVDSTIANKFDAIFMDVRMPEMDGLEALKSLREQGVDAPVFLMSGFGDVASIEDAVKQGAQNFLPKPFKLDRALAMINENKNIKQ